MSTQSHIGTITTSTAVPVVNQTGEAMFGRPFIVRQQHGWIVETPQIVNTVSGTTTAHQNVFTTDAPRG